MVWKRRSLSERVSSKERVLQCPAKNVDLTIKRTRASARTVGFSLKQRWKLNSAGPVQLATSGTSQAASIVVDAGLNCDLMKENIIANTGAIRNRRRERRDAN